MMELTLYRLGLMCLNQPKLRRPTNMRRVKKRHTQEKRKVESRPSEKHNSIRCILQFPFFLLWKLFSKLQISSRCNFKFLLTADISSCTCVWIWGSTWACDLGHSHCKMYANLFLHTTWMCKCCVCQCSVLLFEYLCWNNWRYFESIMRNNREFVLFNNHYHYFIIIIKIPFTANKCTIVGDV